MRPPFVIGPVALTTGSQTIFTAPEGMRLSTILVTNTTAGTLTVTFSHVPAGVTPATVHQILSAQAILANDGFYLVLDLPIFIGDTLLAQASNTGLNFRGIESRSSTMTF